LTDGEWQTSATDERVLDSISNGPGAMPASDPKLTHPQIESLVEFVRKLKVLTRVGWLIIRTAGIWAEA